MIKELLRKHLLKLNEAVPTEHFGERVNEVLYNIESIELPPNAYISNVSKEAQDAYIIKEIQKQVQAKINAVIAKNYPASGKGSCVLVPLGIIKVQPLSGPAVNVMIISRRAEGIKRGYSYNIAIYDNRIPSLLLPDPKHPNNSSPMNQLKAHMANNVKRGEKVDPKTSFVDKSFMTNIIIQMNKFGV